jgi:hypothetical protein
MGLLEADVMRIAHPFRILAVVVGASICLSCQSTAEKSKEPTLLVSELELRSTINAMASGFKSSIQIAVLRMSAKTSEEEVRRWLLFMKKRTITEIETATDHPKVLTSYFDLWSLAYQIELFLENMKDGDQGTSDTESTEAMKDNTGELIAVFRDARLEFEKTAKSIFPPKTYDSVVAGVKEYVDSYAINGSDGAITRIDFGKTAVGSVLSPVLNMTMSPFRAMEGVGKGGDAAKDLVTVVEQFVRVAERTPEHLGWEIEGLLMDVRRDVDETLASIDEKQGSIQGTLKEVQASLATVDSIAARAEVITASVEQTTTTLDSTAGSIKSLLDTYKDTMMTLYPPKSPEEKVAAAAAKAAAPPGETKPFDITEYTATLAELTTASTELQGLLTEVRSTLEGPALDQVIAGATKVTAAALAETTQTVDGLVDTVFRRIIQILFVTFGLAVVFLVLSRWVIRRKPA